MIFKSGKHAGQTAEYVLLRDPGHALFIMGNYPDGAAGKEFLRLRSRLDKKPFQMACRCGDTATRASAYRNDSNLMFWCDDCDPYGSGAIEGRLTILSTFAQAMRHVDWTCDGNRSQQKAVIKNLAEAKGCPARLTQPGAVKFLN